MTKFKPSFQLTSIAVFATRGASDGGDGLPKASKVKLGQVYSSGNSNTVWFHHKNIRPQTHAESKHHPQDARTEWKGIKAKTASRAYHTMALVRFFALPGEAPERDVLISMTILWRLSTSSCPRGGWRSGEKSSQKRSMLMLFAFVFLRYIPYSELGNFQSRVVNAHCIIFATRDTSNGQETAAPFNATTGTTSLTPAPRKATRASATTMSSTVSNRAFNQFHSTRNIDHGACSVRKPLLQVCTSLHLKHKPVRHSVLLQTPPSMPKIQNPTCSP
jgi:hypothetical protein